jgi:hypothetical protein
VLQNRVLRTIPEPKKDEVTGEWKKLYNEELHNLYSSPNISRQIKMRIGWTGHVVCMERETKAYKDFGGKARRRSECILRRLAGGCDRLNWFRIRTGGGLL